MESGLTKNQIINVLSKSPHGKLEEYIPVGLQAAQHEPEFLAHLIAWNALKGQVRDARVALPIVTLACPSFPVAFVENSMAHLAALAPRDLLRAIKFSKSCPSAGLKGGRMRSFVEHYLRWREANWNQVSVMQHRGALRTLYTRFNVRPHALADQVICKGHPPDGTVFANVKQLANMSPVEAAGTIAAQRIPFLVARGALGKKASDPDLVMALIDRMSPTELVTNTKNLERLGVKTNPALRAAFEQALARAGSSKQNTLKTTVAAEAIDDETLKAKLSALQEKQLKAVGGVDGNWLVLGDKSPSMAETIELSRQVSATLAKLVRGRVHLVFFDDTARHINVTGKTYEQILAETAHVTAGGNGTSIGAGLRYALDSGIEVDGIAIVSDGGDNKPPAFFQCYADYCKKYDKAPPIYLYRTDTLPRWRVETERWCAMFIKFLADIGHEVNQFDLRAGIDYYSLPNLVQTMRVNRYSLVEEILDTPLLALDEVLKPTKELSHV